jgi:twitching motility protein PilT
MTLDSLVQTARASDASDIHLEGGLPMTLRVRGHLRRVGEPLSPAVLTGLARGVLTEGWNDFVQRGSADLSRVISGTRCRINVLRSARGVGFAIRLLTGAQVTLQRANLHADLRRLVQVRHGLVLVCGATGSGKTTTLAALLQEVNQSEARHIVTLESPIEYVLTPKQSLIRQREVGRDTPSFEQALLDALREDPDVLVVGEMREPEVMRLTLLAAETGHLVLATVHSSTAAEALQRIAGSFPSEVQSSVCAQLADCLVGVIAQRLHYREELGIRVPQCEILMASTGAKALIRQGQFFKLDSVVETGAADGSWSFQRYAEWLYRKTDWFIPKPGDDAVEPSPAVEPVAALPRSTPAVAQRKPRPVEPAKPAVRTDDGVLVIEEHEDPAAVLRELTRDETD